MRQDIYLTNKCAIYLSPPVYGIRLYKGTREIGVGNRGVSERCTHRFEDNPEFANTNLKSRVLRGDGRVESLHISNIFSATFDLFPLQVHSDHRFKKSRCHSTPIQQRELTLTRTMPSLIRRWMLFGESKSSSSHP